MSSRERVVMKEESVYPTLFSLFQIPRASRPKHLSKRNLLSGSESVDALVVWIEQIYSSKFKSDSTYFKSTIKEKSEGELALDRPSFPLYAFDYLKERFKAPKTYIQVLPFVLNEGGDGSGVLGGVP